MYVYYYGVAFTLSQQVYYMVVHFTEYYIHGYYHLHGTGVNIYREETTDFSQWGDIMVDICSDFGALDFFPADYS